MSRVLSIEVPVEKVEKVKVSEGDVNTRGDSDTGLKAESNINSGAIRRLFAGDG
jgi:hypothetical protein